MSMVSNIVKQVGLALLMCAALSTPGETQDTGFDFGRIRFGMTTTELEAAAPEQHWTRREAGSDLVILYGTTPVQIGDMSLAAILHFRKEHLNKIVFEADYAVDGHDQCDADMSDLVTSLESSIGLFEGKATPHEYGSLANRWTTPRGSTVRVYEDAAAAWSSYSNYRGVFFAEANGFTVRQAAGAFKCSLSVEMRPNGPQEPLPLPAPTIEALAAATLIDPDTLTSEVWVAEPDSDAMEMSVPPVSVVDGVSGHARIDCLVVDGGRLNCRSFDETPPNVHFGDAALALSHYYRMPASIGGHATLGERVQLRLNFSTGPPSRG